MRLDEPAWWYQPGKASAIVRALRPAAAIYAWAVERRFRRARPYRASLPVICIGNLTAGGTGKTPLAMHVAGELLALGESPAFLTRGYGGRTAGPHWIEPDRDTAVEVGDEALLLAQVAPTLVSRDRAIGAREIERKAAASVIVMDDGLQNPSLIKDLAIALVDGRRGIGNGEVLPAGPLRGRLEFQLGLVGAIVVNYPPGTRANAPSDGHMWLQQRFAGPVLAAAPEPQGDVAWVGGSRLVAYAGIANPQRFFSLLEQLGGRLVASVPLPDHHRLSQKDAERILGLAAVHDATPVTTEKDWVRLVGGNGAVADLKTRSRTLAIRLAFDEGDAMRLRSLLGAVLAQK